MDYEDEDDHYIDDLVTDRRPKLPSWRLQTCRLHAVRATPTQMTTVLTWTLYSHLLMINMFGATLFSSHCFTLFKLANFKIRPIVWQWTEQRRWLKGSQQNATECSLLLLTKCILSVGVIESCVHPVVAWFPLALFVAEKESFLAVLQKGPARVEKDSIGCTVSLTSTYRSLDVAPAGAPQTRLCSRSLFFQRQSLPLRDRMADRHLDHLSGLLLTLAPL